MNKKGQMIGIGSILLVFIGVLVGVVLFQSIAQSIGTTQDLATITNTSVTLGANGEYAYLTDYRSLTDTIIINTSGEETIAAGNYTITNNFVYNGGLSVRITTDDALYASSAVSVSGTAQPLTYVPNSGARAVIKLILIFFALAIVVVAMKPVMESDFFKQITGR